MVWRIRRRLSKSITFNETSSRTQSSYLYIYRYKRCIYPGKAAEERGQSESIATNLIEMASLKVPVIAIVIGEGGSGGALGIDMPI